MKALLYSEQDISAVYFSVLQQTETYMRGMKLTLGCSLTGTGTLTATIIGFVYKYLHTDLLNQLQKLISAYKSNNFSYSYNHFINTLTQISSIKNVS